MQASRLREYRERYGLTQADVVAEVQKLAIGRGDIAVPGLDQSAISRHENNHKRPTPYYQALYCDVYGASPAELGFRVALPHERRNDEDMNRREFLVGTAGFVASAALAPVVPSHRLGSADIERLQQTLTHLLKLDDQQGSASVYALTTRNFDRLRGLAEHATYDHQTGLALRELVGHAAEHAGWLAYDADHHDDARGWWLEAMHWARLAEADSVSVSTMASMALQASVQHHPREAIDLSETAQRTAKATTPRLRSVLLAREAWGHAASDDGSSAHDALRRARDTTDTRHDDDPVWLDFYGPADFANHERNVALTLGDSAAAEDSARDALRFNDPVAYPRNHAIYLVRLSEVLVKRREIDESVAVATEAVDAASHLDSARVTRGIADTAHALRPFAAEPNVSEFLERVAA
jgi:transcriptional regulator with XRE-family HTH domain